MLWFLHEKRGVPQTVALTQDNAMPASRPQKHQNSGVSILLVRFMVWKAAAELLSVTCVLKGLFQ